MHGWDGSSEDKYCQNMKVAYLIKGDYNVILLDWSPVASKNYVEAFFKVKTVGKSFEYFTYSLFNFVFKVKSLGKN